MHAIELLSAEIVTDLQPRTLRIFCSTFSPIDGADSDGGKTVSFENQFFSRIPRNLRGTSHLQNFAGRWRSAKLKGRGYLKFLAIINGFRTR